jgi:integrase
MILVAFGGCRQQEVMRLNWENVFREDGHIEIGKTKSKTRSRRLIETPANLFAWLEPYRNCTGPVWTGHRDTFHSHLRDLLASVKIPMRDNALRHAFISHSYALDGNENRVAMQAGNSPGMVHRHYKGLLTRKQAEAYFNVRPSTAANVLPLPAAANA